MKIIIVAMLLATASIASAQEQPQTREQEYRMWSAEKMIERLTEKYVRAHNACGRGGVSAWMPRFSDECKASVVGALPLLATVREIAMSGDEARWAEIIDRVHKFEAEIEGPLNNLERK